MALRDAHRQPAALRALATLSRGNGVLVRARAEDDLLQRMCDAIVAAGEYPLSGTAARRRRGADDRARRRRRRRARLPRRRGRVVGRRPARSRTHRDRRSHADRPGPQRPARPTRRSAVARGTRDVTASPARSRSPSSSATRSTACSRSTPRSRTRSTTWRRRCSRTSPPTSGSGSTACATPRCCQQTRREAVAAAERLRATIDSLIDPFVLLESVRDADGRLVDLRYVEANRAAVAYNRRPREELIGATMLELFPGLLEHGPLASYFAASRPAIPMVLDDVAYANEILRRGPPLRPARREERRRPRAHLARRDRSLRRRRRRWGGRRRSTASWPRTPPTS